MNSRVGRFLTGLLTALVLTILSACSAGSIPAPTPGTLSVVAAFYPFQFAAERIGGQYVTVTNLTPPGAEPHDLELTAKQLAVMTRADLVIYQSGFQAAVDQAVQDTRPRNVLDVATVVKLVNPTQESSTLDPLGGPAAADSGVTDEYGRDPHAWLDPIQMIDITTAVARALSEIDPGHRDSYQSNAADLVTQLKDLDQRYQILTTCPRSVFITSHAAFGYLADRYGLRQIAVAGVSPDEEPSPRRIAQIQQLARQYGVTTIFYETLVSPTIADSIAQDAGLRTAVLDPLEGLTPDSPGHDYLQVMDANLAALERANGCTATG